MGGGEYGGFGSTCGNSDSNNVKLPKSKDQLSHIFGEREGHLPDTQSNREMLLNLANDKSKFVGIDKYGNLWNVSNNLDGSQNWVTYQNNIIQNGGRNNNPRTWNNETGLSNPFKKKGK